MSTKRSRGKHSLTGIANAVWMDSATLSGSYGFTSTAPLNDSAHPANSLKKAKGKRDVRVRGNSLTRYVLDGTHVVFTLKNQTPTSGKARTSLKESRCFLLIFQDFTSSLEPSTAIRTTSNTRTYRSRNVSPVHENPMHRRLLTCDELHRSQVDSLSQARHQGNVSQRPKRHHFTAEKPHRGAFIRGEVSSRSVDVVTAPFPLRIRILPSFRANPHAAIAE